VRRAKRPGSASPRRFNPGGGVEGSWQPTINVENAGIVALKRIVYGPPALNVKE